MGARNGVRRAHVGVPRKPRQDEDGAFHHVFARGNDRRSIYRDDADRRAYLHLLSAAVRDCRWRCLAYCLMDNHVHLLVETPCGGLGRGMQLLHGQYAQAFNKRHGSCGHVFQGRYGAVRVKTDAQLWAVVAYIARNPVEARLCARAEEWGWSSCGEMERPDAPPWLARGRLLELFSGAGGDPLRRYREAVAGVL